MKIITLMSYIPAISPHSASQIIYDNIMFANPEQWKSYAAHVP